MQLVLSEARKQRSFREVWVGYLLAILLLSVFIYSDLGELRMNSSWFQIQQDIHRYVGVLSAACPYDGYIFLPPRRNHPLHLRGTTVLLYSQL